MFETFSEESVELKFWERILVVKVKKRSKERVVDVDEKVRLRKTKLIKTFLIKKNQVVKLNYLEK